MSIEAIHMTEIDLDKLEAILTRFPTADAEMLYPEKCALVCDSEHHLFSIVAAMYGLKDKAEIRAKLQEMAFEV